MLIQKTSVINFNDLNRIMDLPCVTFYIFSDIKLINLPVHTLHTRIDYITIIERNWENIPTGSSIADNGNALLTSFACRSRVSSVADTFKAGDAVFAHTIRARVGCTVVNHWK